MPLQVNVDIDGEPSDEELRVFEFIVGSGIPFEQRREQYEQKLTVWAQNRHYDNISELTADFARRLFEAYIRANPGIQTAVRNQLGIEE